MFEDFSSSDEEDKQAKETIE